MSLAVTAGLAGCGEKFPDCSDPAVTKLANEIVTGALVARSRATADKFLKNDVDDFTLTAVQATGGKLVFDPSGIKPQLSAYRKTDVKKEVGIVTCEASIASDAGQFAFGIDLSTAKDSSPQPAEKSAADSEKFKAALADLAKGEGSAPIAEAPPAPAPKKTGVEEFVEELPPIWTLTHGLRFKDGLKYEGDKEKKAVLMKVPVTSDVPVFRFTAQFADKGAKLVVQAAQ